MNVSRQDQIWNRACLEGGGSEPAAGDTALASVLLAHGLVMNGGVVHALECLSHAQLVAAIAGFKYFGLTTAAHVFEQAPDASAEERLNRLYWQAVPNDGALAHAFRIKLVASPEAFAPTKSNAHV
jgi:hypothetical protein